MGTTTDLDTLPDSANYVREISRDPKTMGDEEVQIRVQPYSEIDTRANTQTQRASTPYVQYTTRDFASLIPVPRRERTNTNKQTASQTLTHISERSALYQE